MFILIRQWFVFQIPHEIKSKIFLFLICTCTIFYKEQEVELVNNLYFFSSTKWYMLDN